LPLRIPGDPRRRIALLAVVLGSAVALPGFTLAASSGLFSAEPQLQSPAPTTRSDVVLVAQNQQSAAQLLVRIQELEDQVRTLTGQVEGLQFQLTQMQTMLQKQAEDNEFRFQQLEGGTPGKKTEAATSSDGATPSNALPQDSASEPAQLPDDSGATLPPVESANDSSGPTPLAVEDDDTIGESNDPLLKGGIDQLGTISEDDSGAQPLSLNQDGGAISKGDAKAQYEAGYDAVTRGDYTFAEEQFSQFLKLYPTDPLAPDATNWLGEALLQRGAYTDAAEVLVNGYTQYKESKRAPDILLKLGVALAGDGQVEYACRTYATLAKTYTNLAPAFRQRLTAEQQKAQCPAP
jgi:tol-pal system protein YbgF